MIDPTVQPTPPSAPRAGCLDFIDANHVRVRGRALIYFGGCDYLRISGHPAVRRAMRAWLQRAPLNSGASRLTTGEHSLYLETERALARCFCQPAALLTGAGYLAPIAAVQGLAAQCSHMVLDSDAHAALADAAALTGKPTARFAFADLPSLRSALKRGGRPLLLTEGLLGARGLIAPLPDYLRLLPKDGWMLVDDAHGAGVLGKGGRGTLNHFGLSDARLVMTLSLSKALGLQGGAVLGSRSFVQSVRANARAFGGNTGPMFPTIAGVAAALTVLREHPEWVAHLQAHAHALHDALPPSPNLVHDPASPVLTITPSDSVQRSKLTRHLLRQGVYPSFIHYLRADGGGFFRFALSTGHTRAQVRKLAMALQEGLA